MTIVLYHPAHDLDILRSAASEMEQYLLSHVLYWPVEGGSREHGQPPSLTPGNLLLAQARLAAAGPQEEFARLNAQVEPTCRRWASAWAAKASHEFPARLEQWNHAVRELAASPAQAARLFAQDVRVRVLLELLLAGLKNPQLVPQLQPADLKLRSLSKTGSFVWDLSLQTAFPSSTYWYLYLNFAA